MNDVDYLVHRSLTNTQLKSGLTPEVYAMTRQLGILHWLNMRIKTGAQIGQDLVLNDVLLHSEFSNVYSIDNITTGMSSNINQAFILPFSSLVRHYNLTGISHTTRRNIYVSQRAGTEHRIVMEIDEDETAIIHAILKQRPPQMQIDITELTDDSDLAKKVNIIYAEWLNRARHYDLPVDWERIQSGKLDLTIPTENANHYPKQLRHIIARIDLNAITLPIRELIERKPGDVARRLRDLDMVSEIGSIRGVYTRAIYGEWEKLNLYELAEYEKRIIGGGFFNIDGIRIGITVILRDKFEDISGQNYLIHSYGQAIVIPIDTHSSIGQAHLFDGDAQQPFENLKEYGIDEITSMCESWEDGLRLPGWVRLFFGYIEKHHNTVTQNTISSVLSEWVAYGQQVPTM